MNIPGFFDVGKRLGKPRYFEGRFWIKRITPHSNSLVIVAKDLGLIRFRVVRLAHLPRNMRCQGMIALGKSGKNDQQGRLPLSGIAPTMHQVGSEKQAVAGGEKVMISLHQVLDIA